MKLALPSISDWTLGSFLEGVPIGNPIVIKLQDIGDDEFDTSTQQNLMTGGDGSKSFSWNLLNSASADAVDVNTSNAGKLTIDCNAVSSQWYGTNNTGVFVYKNFSGDFDVEIHFTDNSDATYEGPLVMVRNPDNSGGENWLAVKRYYGSGGQKLSVHSTVNGTTSAPYAETPSSVSYLRLVRVGTTVYAYSKANSVDSWTLLSSTARSDLPTIVQVGVSASPANTSNNYVAQFDYFRSNIPVFSSGTPVAESPWIAIPADSITDAADAINILENALADLEGLSAGTLAYDYALNGGAYAGSWVSQADLITALRGASITDHTSSLRIKAQFTSDGTQAADIVIASSLDTVLPSGGGGGAGGGAFSPVGNSFIRRSN